MGPPLQYFYYLYERVLVSRGPTAGPGARSGRPGVVPTLRPETLPEKVGNLRQRLFRDLPEGLSYLSRYTHRVAIPNQRLVSLTEGKVSFRARDNNRPGLQRLVTLTAPEFIRRFLLHVLPPRFVKIRHYGLMAPGNVKTELEQARALLSLKAPGALK